MSSLNIQRAGKIERSWGESVKWVVGETNNVDATMRKALQPKLGGVDLRRIYAGKQQSSVTNQD